MDIYFLIFDKEDVIWKQLPSLRRPRHDHTTFVMKNMLHVMGGWTNPYEEGKSIEMFDISAKKWTDGESLPFSLNKVSSIVDMDENVAILFGGSEYTTSMKIFTYKGINQIELFHELMFIKRFSRFICSSNF